MDEKVSMNDGYLEAYGHGKLQSSNTVVTFTCRDQEMQPKI
jgi:hypothetical protein